MSEFATHRHDASIKGLFDGIGAGEHFSKYGKTVEITRGQIKFVGFLVEKSIVIPTDAGGGSDESVLITVGANLEVVKTNSKEPPQPATCHLLGLPYFGNTWGLLSDGQQFHHISGIHLHPKEYAKSQEAFIMMASNALSSKGSKLTIIE